MSRLTLTGVGGGVATPSAPEYSSGTIGAAGATAAVYSKTVEITFTEDVSADSGNFSAGVTISIGSVSYTTFASTNQDGGNDTVRYVLTVGVDGTETVTWAYAKSGGTINSGGIDLENVSAQAVTNTAFEPGDLSGTIKWWHARPSAANGITGSDGDAIETWTENGGSDYTLTQGTSGFRPLLKKASNGINGMNLLRFDGIDDRFTGTKPDGDNVLDLLDLLAYSTFTIWLVIDVTNYGPSGTLFYNTDGIFADGNGYWQVGIDEANVVMGHYGPIGNVELDLPVSLNTTCVLQLRHDSSGFHSSINGGTEVDLSTGDTNNLTHAVRVGSNYYRTVFFDGDLAEMITSNADESSGDRASMQAVLENIYGV